MTFFARPIKALIIVALLAAAAIAQTQQITLYPLVQTPAPVNGSTVGTIGAPGPSQYCYWIVGNYLVGAATPSFAGCTNGPSVLSGSNYNQISFPLPAGVLSADVLRTPAPAPAPSGTCNCAVTTGNVTGQVNDQSNSLGGYTVTPFNPATLAITLENDVISAGVSHLRSYQNGVLIADVSVPTNIDCTQLDATIPCLNGPAAFTAPLSSTGAVTGGLGSSATGGVGIDINENAVTIDPPNDTSTGTTQFLLAKINSSGNAIRTSTVDTVGIVGPCLGNCGNTPGTFAQLASSGVANCRFDAGGATFGDYVGNSLGTAGNCRDLGATWPTSGPVIGLSLQTVGANTNGLMLVFGPGSPGSLSSTISTAVTVNTGGSIAPAGTGQIESNFYANVISQNTSFQIGANSCGNIYFLTNSVQGTQYTVTLPAANSVTGCYIDLIDTAGVPNPCWIIAAGAGPTVNGPPQVCPGQSVRLTENPAANKMAVMVGGTTQEQNLYLGADNAITSSTPTAIFNGTGQAGFLVQASTVYYGECDLSYQAAATGGFVLTWTGPASPTQMTYTIIESTSASATIYGSANGTSYTTALGGAIVTAATNFPIHIMFTLENGTTAGSLVPMFQSNTNTISTTAKRGSECWMRQRIN